MDHLLQKIHNGDCIAGMRSLPEGSIDLVFADPPFNIGYKYDVYDDRLAADEYLRWSSEWIRAVWQALKPNGTFWLAIGDDFAAELKVESLKAGFHCRSWVVWYYTFGVNCSRKFTRSHTHLFHFVKDHEDFTFRNDDPSNRVPSARQLVYNDKRADGKGRLPDDTWLIPPQLPAELQTHINDNLRLATPPRPDSSQTFSLRPQDLQSRFQSSEDVWYFPRVAGTFTERAGFHGCQMPEQLLGRIVRTCSNPDDIVMDPFAGSASTLVVARKLNRRCIGFELSEEYSKAGSERLAAVRVGDPLVGSAEPTMSAPRTTDSRQKQASGQKKRSKSTTLQASLFDEDAIEQISIDQLKEQMAAGVSNAFEEVHDGICEDVLIVHPEYNQKFADACRRRSLPGDPRTWNVTLLRRRQEGKHAHLEYRAEQTPTLEDCAPFLFACELAWMKLIEDERAESLLEVLCDPALTAEFDRIAAAIVPEHPVFHYRWAALSLLQRSAVARVRGSVLSVPSKLGPSSPLENLEPEKIPSGSGVFIISTPKQTLYVGESSDLAGFFDSLRQCGSLSTLCQFLANESGLKVSSLRIQFFPADTRTPGAHAWCSCIASKLHSRFNFGASHSTMDSTSLTDSPLAIEAS
ncbi:MAG: site-specific DNA-methyltransferase [Planctomyces sp.]|nr:site-specific DNA-methyltransferase [Planctomyces sp.]